jgi:hypothetical protein
VGHIDLGIATITAALIAFTGVILGFWLRLRANSQVGLSLAKYVSADLLDKRRVVHRFWARGRTLAVIYVDILKRGEAALKSYDIGALLRETGRFIQELYASERLASRKVYEAKSEDISQFPELLCNSLHKFYKDYFDSLGYMHENIEILQKYGVQEVRGGKDKNESGNEESSIHVDIMHIAKGLIVITDHLAVLYGLIEETLKEIRNNYAAIHHPDLDNG